MLAATIAANAPLPVLEDAAFVGASGGAEVVSDGGVGVTDLAEVTDGRPLVAPG